ncbi:MAG: hypothetical protein ACP5O8_03575, partial [Candidatus Aenigmatarchaeota archaeon]
SAILAFLSIIAISLMIINVPSIFAQYETKSYPMNASIYQVIGITLSDYLKEGILFTNTTTIGIQYPITNMTVWNNATRNYNGTSYGTLYYITASSANQVNIKICHCACDDLTNTTLNARLYINGTGCAGQQGVGWANGTTATNPGDYPPGTNYNFTKPDDYQIVAGSLAPNSAIYLRYWINPCPDNVPSGIYNTTYMFKAVEIGQTCGTCSC